ncbi:unnamed protein product [Schistosoma margrebowiei]|uniref:Uncharacterized protein n=1 Tax=Schistosoma margrebowiei TaxID=48269 RepID=A0A183MHN6_9TREM|nr:unnamed protein product [Schistosoma margrebowiei]
MVVGGSRQSFGRCKNLYINEYGGSDTDAKALIGKAIASIFTIEEHLKLKTTVCQPTPRYYQQQPTVGENKPDSSGGRNQEEVLEFLSTLSPSSSPPPKSSPPTSSPSSPLTSTPSLSPPPPPPKSSSSPPSSSPSLSNIKHNLGESLCLI